MVYKTRQKLTSLSMSTALKSHFTYTVVKKGIQHIHCFQYFTFCHLQSARKRLHCCYKNNTIFQAVFKALEARIIIKFSLSLLIQETQQKKNVNKKLIAQ